MNQLGADAKRVQVLFVTADPARDTAAVMAKYTHAFHPSFIGLRATGAPLAKFTSDYKLFAEAVGTGKDYPVDHTANAYVLDATGKIRLFAPSGFGVANWTHDLKLLIQESPAP